MLLSNGDILAPVQRSGGWDVVRIPPEGTQYVGWLILCQEETHPEMAAEMVLSAGIPVLSLFLAIRRFRRDEVGPGLALLLTGFLGTLLWAIVSGIVVAIAAHMAP